ncbi:MAG: helix-turn-helix domain-containing protein [Rhodospirillales bacterium]
MMTIGEIARSAACKVQTIRYYEQIGLLAPAERSEGNQRLFARKDVERLLFIRHARELGFPIDSIRELLSLSDKPNHSCEAADRIAKAQLGEVERRIDRLTSLKAELESMIEQCSGGRISDCRVIESLGDHTDCHGDDHLPRQAQNN